MDVPSIGKWLADSYGDRYRPVAFETGTGRVAAKDFAAGAVEEHPIPDPPAMSIPAVFRHVEEPVFSVSVEDLYDDSSIRDLSEYDANNRERADTVVVRWADEYAVFIKLHTKDDEKVRAQLAFRDYFRGNPEARREYTRVKRTAAEEHPEDLGAYTKAKTDVVSSILDHAQNEGYYEDLPDFV